MFKVFDRKKKQVDLLENPISPVIVNELGGIGELTFSVPSTYKHLELEGYIQVENDHEYVIKEIVTHGTNRDVVCMLNIEEILGMAWSKFISRDNTLMKCAELVLSGTRWRAIDNSSCNVKRNLYGTVTNSYNLLQMMCTVYNVEFIFDTYNKTVTFVDKVGKDAGVYFINDINLKQLNVDTHTHKYITRVIPIGKNGLTIESVNDGKNYLENKTYSNKNIYGIWQSDKHDDPSALKADAKRFLDEMAIPYETYEVVVDDLYALKGYDEFKYGLGDIVTIIDGDTETRIQQRIIQRTYNLLEPDKDTIHIANKDATFEDYYKRLQTIADMTQSVIGSDGSINGGSISDGTISGDKIENDSINSDHISSGSITSTHIKAEQILADHIMSNQITTNHLVANSITSDHIQANAIDTKHLKANTITSDHIQSNTINSNHISANTITSGHIQSGAITAGSGIIADGAIGNAQISKIDAGKIEAGTIDTSKVTIQGANGHLRLRGNRMQVFDGVGNQAKERVSVGDVNGDGTVYGLRVRGADGQTILLDENGVKSEGITDGAITNNKINEDANIDGAKLNINSVVSKINEDGTEVIKGTKIEVDGTNLNAKLSTITNKQTEDSERITQAYSQITANENAINLKVDEQTYTADKKDMTSKLEKATSDISVMKGQIALKVEQTDIESAKNEINNSVDTKIASAKAEIKVTTDGISQKVGKLETTTATLDGKVTSQESRLTTAEQKITDKAITSVVQESQFIQDMDGKISTNKSNISKIEQTANSITSRVDGLDGKYTQLKQTVDGIDLTGKVSFSDLSTAGKTTINGANIDTTNLRVRGELISGQINGVGGIRFADGAVIASYDSHVTGYKGISVSAPDVKLGDKVAIYHPTMYFDVVGKNNTSSATTTWTMSSAGDLTCASASLSKTLGVSGQANIGRVVTNRIDVYGDSNLDGNTYISGSCTIANALNVRNRPIYGMGSITLDRGTIYLPQGGGNTTTDYVRIGFGIIAGVSSGNFHFLTMNASPANLYASNVRSAYSLEPNSRLSDISALEQIDAINVVSTSEGLRLSSPNNKFSVDESKVVTKVYNEKTNQEEINVDYNSAISTLWKAVQELKQENDELKEKIKDIYSKL